MPTLTVIQGPDHGKHYDVDGATSIIGRDPVCEVPLRDPGVSRHHAVIECADETCNLRDLGSSNGTYVNGLRVRAAELQPGDQIRIGNTIMTLSRAASESALVDHKGLPIQVDTEGLVDSSIISTASASGDPHLAFAGGEDMADMRASIKGLRALYRIAEMLGRNYDIDRLLSAIMDMIFDVVDADRGFILLLDGATGRMVPRAIRYREELLEEIRRQQAAGAAAPAEPRPEPLVPEAARQAPICVSKTIISYVMKRGEGVLTTNAMQDRRFEEGESVQDFGIRSAIAVPIKSRDAILGIIHVDTHVSQGRFTSDDLKLMTAIGCQTALAVENANLMASQMQQERLAAAGQAIASLSHYIKNILQGIHGGSHTVDVALARQQLDTVAKGWDIVSRNLHRINALVLDMLSYSRQTEANLIQTSVNAIVREVAELAQANGQEKQVRVTTKLDTNLPEIPVDPDGLHHACLNLLNNAVEAVPALKGKVEVATRVSPHGSEVWITVADNGPGIAPEDQPKIFQAFYSTKGQKGTGLGLAAAKKIIEEMGGRLTVNSVLGEGAAFCIHLPRPPAPKPPAES